jgi:hypothetical protein
LVLRGFGFGFSGSGFKLLPFGFLGFFKDVDFNFSRSGFRGLIRLVFQDLVFAFGFELSALGLSAR